MVFMFVIYMFHSNNPSSGGYKFVEFALFLSNLGGIKCINIQHDNN